jgi:hypothetical protein
MNFSCHPIHSLAHVYFNTIENLKQHEGKVVQLFNIFSLIFSYLSKRNIQIKEISLCSLVFASFLQIDLCFWLNPLLYFLLNQWNMCNLKLILFLKWKFVVIVDCFLLRFSSNKMHENPKPKITWCWSVNQNLSKILKSLSRSSFVWTIFCNQSKVTEPTRISFLFRLRNSNCLSEVLLLLLIENSYFNA